ncbi:product protein [Spatholobus suberectus]|nr:product protein [Spatholobus suberectus]
MLTMTPSTSARVFKRRIDRIRMFIEIFTAEAAFDISDLVDLVPHGWGDTLLLPHGLTDAKICASAQWSTFEEALKTNPVFAKIVISGTVYSIGDWIAQDRDCACSRVGQLRGCCSGLWLYREIVLKDRMGVMRDEAGQQKLYLGGKEGKGSEQMDVRLMANVSDCLELKNWRKPLMGLMRVA